MLKQKIRSCINQNLPITLILAYGGFKNYRHPNYPSIDWAEVFHLVFLINTLQRISKIYRPGIVLEFSGDSEAMSYVNNIPIKDVKQYLHEFDRLLKYFQSIVPSNFRFESRNFSEFYDYNELAHELDKRVVKELKLIHDFSAELHRAKNNYIFSSKNLTQLQKQKEIELSLLKDHLWLSYDYEHRKEYLEGGINIPILHRKNIPNTYGIKSAKGSDIQFWEGVGVFRDSEFKSPTIISINKFNQEMDKYTVPKLFL